MMVTSIYVYIINRSFKIVHPPKHLCFSLVTKNDITGNSGCVETDLGAVLIFFSIPCDKLVAVMLSIICLLLSFVCPFLLGLFRSLTSAVWPKHLCFPLVTKNDVTGNSGCVQTILGAVLISGTFFRDRIVAVMLSILCPLLSCMCLIPLGQLRPFSSAVNSPGVWLSFHGVLLFNIKGSDSKYILPV